MYNLILADVGGGASPASTTAKRREGAFAAAPTSKRKKNACFQFSETKRCYFSDNCKVSNKRGLQPLRLVFQHEEGDGGSAETVSLALAAREEIGCRTHLGNSGRRCEGSGQGT